MDFLGVHKYVMVLISAVKLAIANIGRLTTNVGLTDSPLKFGKKYSMMIPIVTNSVASQIRRCQKRVNATGWILPPIFITLSGDIMTIMVCFYKSWL